MMSSRFCFVGSFLFLLLGGGNEVLSAEHFIVPARSKVLAAAGVLKGVLGGMMIDSLLSECLAGQYLPW